MSDQASSENQPETPDQPAAPAQPEQPEQVAQPAAPAQPEQPEQPAAQPEQPAQPAVPAQPEQVAQPAAQPEQPEQPAAPAQPEQVAQPAAPAQPEQVDQPATAAQPEQVTQPAAPAQPEQPVAAAAPQPPADQAPSANAGASAIRQKAKTFLDQLVSDIQKKGGQINSNSDGGNPDSAKLFIKYTGTSQEAMEANWKTGGIMTACNGLTGTYASQGLGLNNLGRFDLAKVYPNSFVKADSGGSPKYGDIVKMKKFHVYVSLGDQGRVEAGQGGHSVGHDIIKYRSEVHATTDLEGWIDIELHSAK